MLIHGWSLLNSLVVARVIYKVIWWSGCCAFSYRFQKSEYWAHLCSKLVRWDSVSVEIRVQLS